MSDDAISTDPACIFCKIFAGTIPGDEVVRTDDVLVFRDLNPQAPHHLLAIPKRHAANLGDFVDAGQTVFHLHLHVLAGRDLSWPPG
jgi:histidine triad (HIT) family protein